MILRPILPSSFLALVLTFLSFLTVRGEGEEVRPLRLDGVTLTGPHSYLTENWTTLELTVMNPNSMGRDARVVAFYASQPDLQYARDVWIPPRSIVSTWMLIGPAPVSPAAPAGRPSTPSRAMELQTLIYDRTGGEERLILPRSEERIRTRLSTYRAREPLTCMLLDDLGYEDPQPPPDVTPPSETDDALELVRAFRAGGSRSLSDHVLVIRDSLLPPTPDAFDGVDHFVLAGRRLMDDPPGIIALRRWLEQGGKLWVMLDRTDPDLVRRILGGVAGFEVVDRTSLTTVLVEGRGNMASDTEAMAREFERPLDFVRVHVGPEFTVLHSVNGWPASFTRSVGQGRVIITTLGARGWCRPRIASDTKSAFEHFPDVPILLPPMDALSQELQPPQDANRLTATSLAPLMTEDIGYRVVSLRTAGMIFAGFLVLLLVLGTSLRHWGRLEFLGWVGPLVALSTAAAFLFLGEGSRRAVPPTLAVAQIIAMNPRSSDQAVTGLLGLYRPESGPISLSSDQGGLLQLDMGGLEGHTRRFVMSDVDAWHWENIDLPAGVRLGAFQATAQINEPILAIAHFGPEGLVGKASLAMMRGLSDALIHAPSQRSFAVRLEPDGAFAINRDDLLPSGLHVAGAVLSDRQQKRQTIYSRLLADSKAGRRSDETLFLAWSDPLGVPFTFGSETPPKGSALLSLPLELEPTKPDERVTIPRAFASFRRILSLGATQPNMEGQQAMAQHLRFQIPPSVLPMKIETARLFMKVDAPSRRFTIRGFTAKEPVELRTLENPLDPVEIAIDRDDLLSVDDQGGLHLEIEVSDPAPGGPEQPPKWTIHYLEIEIVGRTLAGKRSE
jgi:hypothetical protein